MAVQIQFRRGSTSDWSTANTILAAGEMGINTTTSQFKIGDGTTAWNSLSYAPISGTLANIDDITNVTITSAASGDLLKWNGSAWVNASGYALLASPTFTGTVNAAALTLSGNLTVSGTTTSINTETLTVDDNVIILNNNVTGAPTENAGIEVERGSSTNVVLRWNETSDKWELTNDGSTYYDIATESYAASLTPATLDAIGDVTITSATSGQFLKWNGSVWVNDAIPVINNIDDITGVTITSAANGQLLQYNGSAWVNATVSTTPTWEDGNNILANALFG